MPTGLVFFIAVLAVVLVGAVFSWRREKARAAAWQQAASRLGFAFQAEGDLAQIRTAGDLALFAMGRSRQANNVLTGRTDNNDVMVFDYQYSIGGGGPKSGSQTWQQTVALYPGAARSLPDCHLMPENPITRWANKTGGIYPDINIASRPLFSSQYLLRGPDETAIRAAFTDQRMAFFEQEPGWVVEVKDGNVGIYRAGQRVSPADLATFLERSHRIVGALMPA